MSGAVTLMLGGSRKASINFTMTCGELDESGDGGNIYRGYDNELLGVGIGSLSPGTTYLDNTGTTRTIGSLFRSNAGTFTLVLSGGAPNIDATFRTLTVNGTTLQRSAASYNGSNGWEWNSGLPTVPGSGNVTVTFAF